MDYKTLKHNKWVVSFSILVCGVVISTACSPINNENINDKISYTKDSRTGLCFATHCLGCQSAIMTNVPCTKEVERLIPTSLRNQ